MKHYLCLFFLIEFCLIAGARTYLDHHEQPPPQPPPATPGDCIMVGQMCGNKDFYCALQTNSVCAVPPDPEPPGWPPSNWRDGNMDGCGCVY